MFNSLFHSPFLTASRISLQDLTTDMTRVKMKRKIRSSLNVALEVTPIMDDILSLKKLFQEELSKLKEETEKLKSIYPLYDVLASKQIEVERMEGALQGVALDHPEREAIENMVKAHQAEREELKWLIQQAEHRFLRHFDQIRVAQMVGSEKESAIDNSLTAHSFKERPLPVPEF
jgi:hypothetical protein